MEDNICPVQITAFTKTISPSALPPLNTPVLISTSGANAFADFQLNKYIIFYQNASYPSDLLFNLSFNGSTWYPSVSATVTQKAAIKHNIEDCIFNSSFNIWDNVFALAWQENNLSGILNIKYVDTIITTTAPTTASGMPLYVFPHVNVQNQFKTQNIPFNNIQIIDGQDNTFNLDARANIRGNKGYSINTEYNPQFVTFVQEFRQPLSTVNIYITNAPTPGNLATPIINYPISIYFGTTNLLFKTVYTNLNGQVSVQINAPGNYTFSLPVLSNSINYQQMIL